MIHGITLGGWCEGRGVAGARPTSREIPELDREGSIANPCV